MADAVTREYITKTELEEILQNRIIPLIKTKETEDSISKSFLLIERITRVEEEIKALSLQIKAQNEKFDLILHEMDKRFEQVDKRFEQMHNEMNKRFEEVDKRFRLMQWTMMIGFTILAAMMSLFKFFVP